MSPITPLASHLAPDTIARLERAAKQRVADADCLSSDGRRMVALYLLGYAVEMCLSAAYFRSAGFGLNTAIDGKTRKLRMTQARKLRSSDGEPLMSSEPHPLVGWARYLEWHRERSGAPSAQEKAKLRESIRRAAAVYRHWRPELRYKLTEVKPPQFAEARLAVEWFVQNLGRL
jgi:hypothetical protein